MAALEVLRGFADEYNGRPPVTIRLVDWADEEGARFGRSLLGSSAFAGTHSIDADRGRTDKDGIRLEDALRRCGVEIDRFPEARARAGKTPPLIWNCTSSRGRCWKAWACRWAWCLGTKGVERHAITFHGQEAHSGSTPMNARRDALAAAAKLALEIRTIAGKHPDAVCTMGSVKTFPGIVTAVVGRCEATLDQRDLDAAVLARNVSRRRVRRANDSRAKNAAPWNGRASGTSSRCRFIPTLIAFCEAAIRETAGVVHRLPSGPLHDAAEVSRSRHPDGDDVRPVAAGHQPQ